MTLSSNKLRLIAAFAALNLLIAVGGWTSLVSPQQQDAATAAASAQQVLSEIAALEGNSNSHGTNKPPVIHTSDLYALDTALPSQEDTPNLLFELDQLAKASGVSVLGVSPQPAQATATGYTILPINLQLSGTYFQLHDFLRSLRTLVSEQQGRLIAKGPLFAVTSTTLGQGSSGHDLLATVGIAAFYYGVTAGATAPVNTSTSSTTTTSGS